MKDKKFNNLSDYISWGDFDLVKDELYNFTPDEMLYKNGKYYVLAIQSNNCDILSEILDKVFSNDSYIQEDLTQILTNYILKNDVSLDIKEVLSQYLLDQVSTSDRSSKSLDEFDLDPLKYFSDISTREDTPDQDINCAGDANSTNTFDS